MLSKLWGMPPIPEARPTAEQFSLADFGIATEEARTSDKFRDGRNSMDTRSSRESASGDCIPPDACGTHSDEILCSDVRLCGDA